MASITIRNLDESIKKRLRVRAASHNHSMEEEVRIILKSAVQDDNGTRGMGTRIQELFSEAGGIDLPDPARTQVPRKPESLE